jgi:CRISPR-associated endonuclease/helicase Cas3
LQSPKAPVVQRVATALQFVSGNGEAPVLARRLRGGVPREDDWARTPRTSRRFCARRSTRSARGCYSVVTASAIG